MHKSVAGWVVVISCLGLTAVRGEEPVKQPRSRVELSVDFAWPVKGNLQYCKEANGVAAESGAAAKAPAAAACPSDKWERIGIDFEGLPFVGGDNALFMLPQFIAPCPSGPCPPCAGPAMAFHHAPLAISAPLGARVCTGEANPCTGDCKCCPAGCCTAGVCKEACCKAGCVSRCAGDCPCAQTVAKSAACPCIDCQCGECRCNPPDALAHHPAALWQRLLEATAARAALEATVEAHVALAEEREEMFGSVAELMAENAKLTARLESQREHDELHQEMLKLVKQNLELKAELALTEAKAKLAQETAQLAVEKHLLTARIAELERQNGGEQIRTAKRQK